MVWRLKRLGYPVESMTLGQISFVHLLEHEQHGEQMLVEARNVANGISVAFAKDASTYENLRRDLIGD